MKPLPVLALVCVLAGCATSQFDRDLSACERETLAGIALARGEQFAETQWEFAYKHCMEEHGLRLKYQK